MWVCICAHSFQAWNHVSCFVKVLMCTDDIGNGSFSFNLLGLFEKIITSPMRDIQNAWYTLNVSYGTIKRQDVLPTFQVPYTNMYINLKKTHHFWKGSTSWVVFFSPHLPTTLWTGWGISPVLSGGVSRTRCRAGTTAVAVQPFQPVRGERMRVGPNGKLKKNENGGIKCTWNILKYHDL